MEAPHEGFADVAVFPIAFHLGHIQHILLGIAFYDAVFYRQNNVPVIGDGDPIQGVDHVDLHRLGPFIHRKAEVLGNHRPLHPHGVEEQFLVDGRGVGL